jgi:hypothetical protein
VDGRPAGDNRLGEHFRAWAGIRSTTWGGWLILCYLILFYTLGRLAISYRFKPTGSRPTFLAERIISKENETWFPEGFCLSSSFSLSFSSAGKGSRDYLSYPPLLSMSSACLAIACTDHTTITCSYVCPYQGSHKRWVDFSPSVVSTPRVPIGGNKRSANDRQVNGSYFI